MFSQCTSMNHTVKMVLVRLTVVVWHPWHAYSALTPTGKGKETKREHRKSWGPSNATAALRGTKTSFFKTLAKRNKSKQKKVDEVTRVLGPASQPAVPHVKRGVNRKGKLKGNKKERVSRKGKSKDSKKGAKFSSGRSKKIKRNWSWLLWCFFVCLWKLPWDWETVFIDDRYM